MEYQRFAALRQEACRVFEQSLETARRAPRQLGYAELEQLAVLYRQLLHDHALARSRFPGTAIARRLELYEAETAPLLSWAEDRGILHVVDGLGTEDEVFARLQKVIATV